MEERKDKSNLNGGMQRRKFIKNTLAIGGGLTNEEAILCNAIAFGHCPFL